MLTGVALSVAIFFTTIVVIASVVVGIPAIFMIFIGDEEDFIPCMLSLMSIGAMILSLFGIWKGM